MSREDQLVMLQVLDCKTRDTVWTYAVIPHNRPHFTRLIQKIESLADYIVEKNKD